MTFSGPTQSNTTANYAVTALDPPPEGKMVVPLNYVLTYENPQVVNSYSFNNLNMSQVVSLYIDNTNNPYPLMLTHGVANQTAAIPAGGGGFIPTTSNKGTYFLSLGINTSNLPPVLASGAANNFSVGVTVTLYNYEVAPAIFGTTIEETTVTISNDVLQNPIYNAGAAIFQRVSPVVIASGANGYTADGWIVAAAGGSVSVSQAASIGLSSKSLSIAGSANNTDTAIVRRVEAALSAPFADFAGSLGVLQFKALNNTGVILTPQITLAYPNAADNYAGTTIFNALATQPCPNGVTEACAVAFPIVAGFVNGLQITIDFGAIKAGQSVQITDMDFSLATPDITAAGIIASAPTPRLANVAIEQAQSERYFRWCPFDLIMTATASQQYMSACYSFTTMRAVPAISISGGLVNLQPDPNFIGGAIAITNIYNNSQIATRVTQNRINIYCQSNAAGFAQFVGYRFSLSAEL